MDDRQRFEVSMEEPDRVGETLIVGLSNPGMAGLTATDYVVRHEDCDRIGKVAAHGFPSPVPFAEGVPRDHSRLYSLEEPGSTILISELYLPVGVGVAFADAVADWMDGTAVSEVAILNGVPLPHGPEEHRVFSVATEEYRTRRLADAEVPAIGGGVLDGTVGELVSRCMEGSAPSAGVYITPTHPPGPDVDAAIRFLDTLEETHGLDVDVSELRKLSEEMKRYYAEMAERMKTMEERTDRDYPEDMAFM